MFEIKRDGTKETYDSNVMMENAVFRKEYILNNKCQRCLTQLVTHVTDGEYPYTKHKLISCYEADGLCKECFVIVNKIKYDLKLKNHDA